MGRILFSQKCLKNNHCFISQIHYFSGQSLSVVPGNVITVRCSALPNVHLATFDQSTFTQGAKAKKSLKML